MQSASANGKICIVTGATSGIGREVAMGLGRAGFTVVLVGRDPAKLAAVRAELAAAWSPGGPRPEVHVLVGDFEKLDDVRRVAREILALCPRIDVLVNNAGAVFTERRVTADGIERTFALNHLAPFLLTNLLFERIAATPGARVVNVASDAHFMIDDLAWDDLSLERSFGRRGWDAYCQSKLANILFTRELSSRLARTGQLAFSLHPGFVRTGLGKNNGLLSRVVTTLLAPFARSPEKGAETAIWAATSDEAKAFAGAYLFDRAPRKTSRAARDDDRAKRLWNVSARLVDLPAPAAP